MKNILIVILVLIIGFLLYTQVQKPKNINNQNTQAITTSTDKEAVGSSDKTDASVPEKTPETTEIKVAGMQKYVDSEFGFSFWYPADLKVTKTSTSQWSDKDIQDATVLTNIAVGDINIKVARSTTRTITDNIAYFGKVTYYFNKDSHLWMKSTTGTFVPANIDDNTMGGLHLFPGIAPYNTMIIPLSANTFVVVGDQQIDNRVPYIARTVVAADPSVGVVQSADIQTRTIQSLKNIFATGTRSTASPGLKTFSDPLNGFSFQYEGTIVPSVYTTKNGTNISAQGCYIVFEGEGNGTNNKDHLTVHGINYCVSTFSDCAMNQCGHERYYTTYGNGSYVTIQYTTFTHNCSVGDNVAACEQEQSTRLAKELQQIEDSLGTLKFSKI